MGVFPFSINIKADKNDLNLLLSEYAKNDIFRRAFSFSFLDNGDFDAGIEAVFDNFLPTNYLIFIFLSNAHGSIVIYTNGFEHLFNFDDRSEFINYMCNAWDKRLEYVYCNFGTLLLDTKKYHRSRNKLYSKYYKKLKL